MGTIAPTGVGAIDFSSFNEAGWDNPPYRYRTQGLRPYRNLIPRVRAVRDNGPYQV